MKLLILTLFACIADAYAMRVYGPGAYTIRPFDIDYAGSIVVELWSAGGTNCQTYCMPYYPGGMPAYGAGSGAYVKASIDFQYSHAFTIVVGQAIGGFNQSCDGGPTGIYGKGLNISISGGQGPAPPIGGSGGAPPSPPYCQQRDGGQVVSLLGSDDVYYQSGAGGENDAPGSYGIGGCKGGDAPNGGRGGACTSSYVYMAKPNMNGTTPGGGGGGSYTSCPRCALLCGKGGDGMAILYY